MAEEEEKIPQAPAKQTMGRQKIAIRKIEKKSNLQVTFSKRRNGLMNKATELSILCGAQVAVIAFSPCDKVFSFGFPDTDSVIQRYIDGLLNTNNNSKKKKKKKKMVEGEGEGEGEGEEETLQLLDYVASAGSSLYQTQALREEYDETLNRFQVAKDKKQQKRVVKSGRYHHWWEEERVEEMGMKEVEDFVRDMEKLRKDVTSTLINMNY